MENQTTELQNQNKSGNASEDKKPTSENEKVNATEQQNAQKDENQEAEKTEQKNPAAPAQVSTKISDTPDTEKNKEEIKSGSGSEASAPKK